MATIEIHRPMDYFGICRKLKVWIDGVHIGGVRTEETEIFEVTDAIHTVQVSMDWCKSVPYEVEGSNGKATKLIARTKYWMPIACILGFVRPSLVFAVVPKENT